VTLFTLRACALVIVVAGARNSGAQARTDFTGVWKLDTTATTVSGGGRGDRSGNASGGGGRAGGGLGLGPPAQELRIRHDSSTLRVTEFRGGDSVVITYRLDGRRTTNATTMGRGRTADAFYTTSWDGLRFVTNILTRIENRGGVTTLEYREVRSLATDGAMVIETTFVGGPGGRTAVYRRQ
jgi:hypothetical protein